MIESLAKSAMVLLLGASVPIESLDPTVWCQWGLAGVVVVYVLWRDAQRERRMAAAIDSQQRWIRETLVKTLERNATAMERMATWLEVDDADHR